jgi:hypothetical protein
MFSLLKEKFLKRKEKETTVERIEQLFSSFKKEPYLAVVLLDHDGLQIYSYEPRALFKGDYLQGLLKVFDFFDRELKESFSMEEAVRLADILEYRSHFVTVSYGPYRFVLARRKKLNLIIVLPKETFIDLKEWEDKLGELLESCETLLKDSL